MARLGIAVPGGIRIIRNNRGRHPRDQLEGAPVRHPPPEPLEDTITVATRTSNAPPHISHTVFTTTAGAIPNSTSAPSKPFSNTPTTAQDSKQPTVDPKSKPPAVSIIVDPSSVTGASQKPNADRRSQSTGDCIRVDHTLRMRLAQEDLSTWVPAVINTTSKARNSPGVGTLAIKNRKRDVATTTPSRPTRTRRQPYWLHKENCVPLVSSRPQVDGGNSVSPPCNIWDIQQESPPTKQKLPLGQAVAPLRVLQQIENSQTQAQDKPGPSALQNSEVSNKEPVEPTRYNCERSSSPCVQQFHPTGQSLQTAALKPGEKLNVIQEFIKVAPAMPELSPPAAGDNALPESTSRDIPKNVPARRLRKRRNSEIATAIADIVPSPDPPPQPSVERPITPVRVTRAFAAGTRPAPAELPYARKYAKKTEIVTESTLPKFSMPTSTIDPDTIVLQYTGQAKMGIQASKSTQGKPKTGNLSNNTRANAICMVDLRGPQTRASIGRTIKHRIPDARVEEEREDVNQAEEKQGNVRPKAWLNGNDSPTLAEKLTEYSEASPQASSSHRVPSPQPPVAERDTSESSENERRLTDERAQVSLGPEPFPEGFREPYASTFFTPHLDDYDLPSSVRAPPLYYHTELPSHPPLPDRSLSTPVRPVPMTSMVDMSAQSTIRTDVLKNADIAKLLEPMTDTEGDGDEDATLSSGSDGNTRGESNSIVRFPRDATEHTAAEYAVLKQVLKAGLEKQKEVQGRLEASLEDQKTMVKAQEDFEKAEQWGERSGPARWAGTRSRGGMTADGPDFLEYLRAKAKED